MLYIQQKAFITKILTYLCLYKSIGDSIVLDIIWIIVLVVFAIWWFVIADLDKAGILAKYNITTMGPLIMVRTFRGQKLLDWIAKPRWFWKSMINVGIPIILLIMILMGILTFGMALIMIINLSNVPAPSAVNAPQNILAIPGVNQFIPLVWGWVALIIAMVVHEFGHAILAKVDNIKVKSLGLLLIPVPIGAFAEIDEEELFGTKSEGGTSDVLGPMDTKAAGAGKRKASSMAFIRILSAGVLINLIVAILAFALLFGPVMGSIAATDSGVYAYGVTTGSIADNAGLKENTRLTTIDGQSITDANMLNAYIRANPNKDLALAGVYDGKPVQYTLHNGDSNGAYVILVTNTSGMPGAAAGITTNMRIVAINGTSIATQAAFMDYMNTTVPGQMITVTAMDGAAKKDYPITLAADPTGVQHKGFIGVTTSDNSLGFLAYQFDAQAYLDGLNSMPSSIGGWFRIIMMPVLEFTQVDQGYNVFHGPYASQFHVTGWLAPLGSGTIYNLVDCLFWIAWLNFNISICNCLPIIPFDGGHILREVMRVITSRFVKNEETVEKISKAVVSAFSITLFASIIFMFVAPYITQWFLR